jgi:hypothetical protein
MKTKFKKFVAIAKPELNKIKGGGIRQTGIDGLESEVEVIEY